MMGQTHKQQLAEGAFKRKGEILARWESGDSPLADLLVKDARLARAAEWIVLRVVWSEGAEKRGEHALRILADAGSIARVTPHHHTVQSGSDASKRYNVRQKRCKWSCDCPDHRYRKAQCKHMLAVMCHVVEREESIMNLHANPADQNTVDKQPDFHVQPVGEHPEKCAECGCTYIIKWGFTGKGEKRRRRYRCKNPQCMHTFVHRRGFERMRNPSSAILRSLNDFFKGHTPKTIADSLKKAGCVVDRSSIYRWIVKYSNMAYKYLKGIPIRTGERVCGDEVRMSGKDEDGDKKTKRSAALPAKGSDEKKLYLFSTTDIQTRFCLAFEMSDHKDGFNATSLLKETAERAGKVPAEFVSDALSSYSEAHQEVFAAKNPLDKNSVHISNASLKNKKRNNNFQERFNGTFRAFQRPRRGITDPHSPLITGFFTYYNFIRPHSSLNEITPAEAAGIIIHGVDEWETVIGNAYLAVRAKEAGP